MTENNPVQDFKENSVSYTGAILSETTKEMLMNISEIKEFMDT